MDAGGVAFSSPGVDNNADEEEEGVSDDERLADNDDVEADDARMPAPARARPDERLAPEAAAATPRSADKARYPVVVVDDDDDDDDEEEAAVCVACAWRGGMGGGYWPSDEVDADPLSGE